MECKGKKEGITSMILGIIGVLLTIHMYLYEFIQRPVHVSIYIIIVLTGFFSIIFGISSRKIYKGDRALVGIVLGISVIIFMMIRLLLWDEEAVAEWYDDLFGPIVSVDYAPKQY